MGAVVASVVVAGTSALGVRVLLPSRRQATVASLWLLSRIFVYTSLLYGAVGWW